MRKARPVEPGDGSPLKPYTWTDVLSRSLLGITHADHTYAVDYDFFAWDGKVALYRDGHQTAKGKHPTVFPVDGGRIEFAATLYGVTRAHLVLTDGDEQPLSPHPRSGEAWRERLARRHPEVSRLLSAAAIVTLILGLVFGVMAVLQTVTHTELVSDHLDWRFTPPVTLSGTAAAVLSTAGLLAIVERALSMRHHWLLDADTWWMT